MMKIDKEKLEASNNCEETKNLEDILYAKAAKSSIEEGLASRKEVTDLLESI